MKLPKIIPPSDLLKQIEGIESSLSQRKRITTVGLLATSVQVGFLLISSQWFQDLIKVQWVGKIPPWVLLSQQKSISRLSRM